MNGTERPESASSAELRSAREQWVDHQMNIEVHQHLYDVRETILTGIVAGIGTSVSTVVLGIIKWAIIATVPVVVHIFL
jgi:hypothetical protein